MMLALRFSGLLLLLAAAAFAQEGPVSLPGVGSSSSGPVSLPGVTSGSSSIVSLPGVTSSSSEVQVLPAPGSATAGGPIVLPGPDAPVVLPGAGGGSSSSSSPTVLPAPGATSPATTTAATTTAATTTAAIPVLAGVGATTTAPLIVLQGADFDKTYDIGQDIVPQGTLAVPPSTTVLSYAKAPGIPQSAFGVAAQGAKMELSFDLTPGTYTIDLGFVETDLGDCAEGKRVFNVYINDQIRLEAYDIFKQVGCRNAVKVTFLNQAVDPVLTQKLKIRLQAIAGPSTLSYVRIRSSNNQCVPEIKNPTVKNEDHVAHSIPGIYPKRPNPNSPKSYVDVQNKGFVNVFINGQGSHTHLFDSATDQSGRITSYLWTNAESGEVLSRKATFTLRAKLGTTRLRLKVVDSGCSTDEAETTVTVTGSIQNGAFCYYYAPQASLLLGGTLLDANVRPVFAAKSENLNFGFAPFAGSGGLFTARCFFAVSTTAAIATPLNVDTGGSGVATLYKGPDLVVDTRTSPLGATVTATGLTAFELVYQRTSVTAAAKVEVKVNNVVPSNGALSYDQAAVLPVITEVTPSTGSVGGGARIQIKGSGMFLPLDVTFGPNVAVVDTVESTPSRLFVTLPPGAGAVSVVATSKTGLASNALPFTYGAGCADSIGFNIQEMAGLGSLVNSPTAAALWQDGRMYIGTRPGDVKVLSYNPATLTVTSVCTSEKLTDERYKRANGQLSPRVVLGITFDPRDTIGMPYVSTSTLFWERQSAIDPANIGRWSNGAVLRLKPATAAVIATNPGRCLMYDKLVVANLPVSDSDHAINDLLFTQDGDLLISVGGLTNGGLPFWKMGSTWESPLSASIVIARLSRPTFNGIISYSTPGNLRTARPLTTDVETYAVGVRNLFRMLMMRDGTIYAADMGPNCGFGNMSYACSEYNEAAAALRDEATRDPFPGTVLTGDPKKCEYGGFRKDKLIKVVQNAFYGHPNLQRGNDECTWIDQNTNLAPKPFETAPPPRYRRPVALLQSASTGMLEYGGSHFCSALRGELIISAYKGFRTLRARLAAGGDSLSNIEKMFSNGGLVALENERGDLIFPKLIGGMPVARPKVAAPVGLVVYNAIPYRFGAGGGGRLIIGGAGFVTGASVTVGSSPCPIVSLAADRIVCTVPPGLGGSRANVAVTVGASQSVLSGAILYMNV